MKKIIDVFKNHFVEIVGFIIILILIVVITYLKFYKHTYTCELKSENNGASTFEKYTIYQKNNHINKISYYYKVTASSKEERKELTKFYNELLKENKNNNVSLSFENDVLTLKYNVSKDKLNKDKNYKNAKTVIRNLKSDKFICK